MRALNLFLLFMAQHYNLGLYIGQSIAFEADILIT